MTARSRSVLIEALVAGALVVVSLLASQAAMRGFRAAGAQPFFYQSNFEPAVMMACGRGFVTSALAPPELTEFLNVARDRFDCARLPAAMTGRALTSAANANWYYLYGAAAAVWRVTGVSWTALDVLVSIMSATVCAALYGLFRLVTARAAAAALAIVLTLSPANLTHLLSLRDYSKAPFVLAAVLILAALVMRPMSRAATLALAAGYGVVVGSGYGFRGDLAIMVPFGAVVVLLFLPGALRASAGRNALAAAALLVSFYVVAWPVIRGLQFGGCQYHFSLLGLTDALTTELRLTPSLYRFGEQTTDTFADLVVGDYAVRVMSAPLPRLCTAAYDTASGGLYVALARTFPADFVVRAYASVLMILRVGLAIPAAMIPMLPFSGSDTMTAVYAALSAITSPIAILGVLMTLAAVMVAWASSIRLGLALTIFVLFLAGYPAIRFDERHWFHLRFIPWWAAALVITQLLRRGAFTWERARVRRAAVAAGLLLATLAIALAALRWVQTRSVAQMIARYLAAPSESLAVHARDASSLLVDWQPRDYADPATHEHRASDLIAVTLDAAQCAGAGPLAVTVRYDADVPTHDMTSTFRVPRPLPAAAPTKLFVPVFWEGVGDRVDLRFAGFQIADAPLSCIGRVALVAHDGRLPLWLEMQVPADWMSRPLYESMRPPRLLTR